MGYEDLKSNDFQQFKSYNALSLSGETGIGSAPRTVTLVHCDFRGFVLHNNDAATRWIQVFFSTAVFLGSTPPDLTFMLGSSQSVAMEFQNPIRKIGSNGLTVAATTTETGTTAPTVLVTGEILYKELT